jgi:hypothetical protein
MSTYGFRAELVAELLPRVTDPAPSDPCGSASADSALTADRASAIGERGIQGPGGRTFDVTPKPLPDNRLADPRGTKPACLPPAMVACYHIPCAGA